VTISMLKLLTTFSSERGFKECRVRLCSGHDGSARGRASTLSRAGLCTGPGDWAGAKGTWDGGRTPCDDGALAGHSAAGKLSFCAAYLTVWGAPERRTNCMDAHMQTAEEVRQACLVVALQAYEEAGISGLYHEGCWACAVDTVRALPLRPLVQVLLLAAEDEEGGGLPSSGTRAAPRSRAHTRVASTRHQASRRQGASGRGEATRRRVRVPAALWTVCRQTSHGETAQH